MGAEVVQRRYARSAMLVTGGLESHDHSYHQQVRMTRFPTAARSEQRDAQDVVCLPPLGTRLFWYVEP
jgi:chaperone BCS1